MFVTSVGFSSGQSDLVTDAGTDPPTAVACVSVARRVARIGGLFSVRLVPGGPFDAYCVPADSGGHPLMAFPVAHIR